MSVISSLLYIIILCMPILFLDMLTSDSFKLFCMLTAEVIFSIIMLFLVYNGLKCIANRIHVSMS